MSLTVIKKLSNENSLDKVFLCEENGNYYVRKVFGSHLKSERLHREIEIYSKYLTFTPRFISSDEDSLITEGLSASSVATPELLNSHQVFSNIKRFHSLNVTGPYFEISRNTKSSTRKGKLTNHYVYIKGKADIPYLEDMSNMLTHSKDLDIGSLSLIHGDLHKNNILYDKFEEKYFLIDFDKAALGDAAYDLAYFLYYSFILLDHKFVSTSNFDQTVRRVSRSYQGTEDSDLCRRIRRNFALAAFLNLSWWIGENTYKEKDKRFVFSYLDYIWNSRDYFLY